MLKPAGINAFTFTNGNGYILRVSPQTMEGTIHETPHRSASGPDFTFSASALAASPCQEKEQDIQREISYAEKHHNQSRIDGLNTALRQVRENCSDSKLKADHKQKILYSIPRSPAIRN